MAKFSGIRKFRNFTVTDNYSSLISRVETVPEMGTWGHSQAKQSAIA